MNFWQWIAEKKKALIENEDHSFIPNSELLIKLDFVEAMYLLYTKDEEQRKVSEREEKYRKIYQEHKNMIELNRKVCELGICVHSEHQKVEE